MDVSMNGFEINLIKQSDFRISSDDRRSIFKILASTLMLLKTYLQKQIITFLNQLFLFFLLKIYFQGSFYLNYTSKSVVILPQIYVLVKSAV